MTPGLFVYKKANLPRMFSRFAFVLRFIAIFKNSAYQNGIFAICSLRMLLVHEKRKLL